MQTLASSTNCIIESGENYVSPRIEVILIQTCPIMESSPLENGEDSKEDWDW